MVRHVATLAPCARRDNAVSRVRAYARKFDEDEEKWSVVGLIHDFDYEMYPNAPDHPLKGSEIL
jgi:predicted hydrolase (HD superfamily)